MIMMKLGVYVFSIDTAAYQALKRVDKYRWQTQNRLSHEPHHQYVGPGETTVELSGVIYAEYKGGIRQVALMRQEAMSGKPLMLVDGTGNIHGKWCIKHIEENNTVFADLGKPKKIEFRLELTKQADEIPNFGA